MSIWEQLYTKHQWPVGHKEKVGVWDEQTGKTVIGYIYAIDKYSIVLYDEVDKEMGKFPKECINQIFR